MKLILVGRSGSGKTSVMESLLGYTPSLKSPTNTVTRFGLPLTIADSLGFFSVSYDQQACTMKLAECVYSFTPGPDAFGLVIRIGRFTAEERKMVDIFRETFGEEVFQFTILIFTQIDDLLYDNVSLDEFLADSTPELRNVISLCGGRYTGFSNTGSWDSRRGYGQSLVSMIQTLQTKNNSVYTVDMLEKATRLKMKKEEEKRKRKEETHRQLKEEMKATIRQELQDQIRKDIEEKLSREEQEQKMMGQTFPQLKTQLTRSEPQQQTQTMKQYDQTKSLQITGQEKKSQKHPMYSSATTQFHSRKDKMEQRMDKNMKLILVGRSGSGKTSVMESLMGSPLTSQNQICAVTRFGQQLTIAETFGFFSKSHDVNTCTMKLAESVYSFQPGPDVFGLLIPIGRYTDEEKKMVKIFRETLGEDVFRFTILIFTRLDDLIYDNIPLDNFLEKGTTEMKELLTLCGGRYIGFDNTASFEERRKYSQSLISMAKTLQMKNNAVFTVAMLEKATIIKMKRDEEETRRKEESRRQLKEEIKETIRQELQDQIRKDIEEKLLREDQECQRKVLTLPQTKPHLTTVEHELTPLLKETHQEREERGHNMMILSTSGKDYNTKEKNKQVPSGLHPETDNRKRRPKIYSRQQESISTLGSTTEQSPVKGSPKKEKEKNKRSNQKPALKTKPSLKKNNKKKMECLVKPCKKCLELNDPQATCCEKCGAPIAGVPDTKQKLDRKAAPAEESPRSTCVKRNEKEPQFVRANPLPKPPRHGIDSNELRIVLIGKTGVGKSATANTLLGKDIFAARASMKSVTEKCQYHRSERWGRHIMIVDTPGLFDTHMSKEVISKEIKKSVAISAPGPHAFILVASLRNRFTQEEQKVLNELEGMFGQNMMKYLVVVFTGRDQLDNVSQNNYADDSPEPLKGILESARGGYLSFNNRGTPEEKERDAKNLLDRIETMVKANGGSHFTSEMFKEAEEIMQARIARELERKERQLRQEIEMELRAEMEETMRKEREFFRKLHEANVWHMEQMKAALKAEKEKNTNTSATRQESDKILDNIVKEEAERVEKKNHLILQLEKIEGAERVRMQNQLADVGNEIKEIMAKRKAAEEEVTANRVTTAVVLKSEALREEERKKIEKEDESAVGFVEGIKALGNRFINLFKGNT